VDIGSSCHFLFFSFNENENIKPMLDKQNGLIEPFVLSIKDSL
jgi:hypothetical protein